MFTERGTVYIVNSSVGIDSTGMRFLILLLPQQKNSF
jgi:hypothetical protein